MKTKIISYLMIFALLITLFPQLGKAQEVKEIKIYDISDNTLLSTMTIYTEDVLSYSAIMDYIKNNLKEYNDVGYSDYQYYITEDKSQKLSQDNFHANTYYVYCTTPNATLTCEIYDANGQYAYSITKNGAKQRGYFTCSLLDLKNELKSKNRNVNKFYSDQAQTKEITGNINIKGPTTIYSKLNDKEYTLTIKIIDKQGNLISTTKQTEIGNTDIDYEESIAKIKTSCNTDDVRLYKSYNEQTKKFSNEITCDFQINQDETYYCSIDKMKMYTVKTHVGKTLGSVSSSSSTYDFTNYMKRMKDQLNIIIFGAYTDASYQNLITDTGNVNIEDMDDIYFKVKSIQFNINSQYTLERDYTTKDTIETYEKYIKDSFNNQNLNLKFYTSSSMQNEFDINNINLNSPITSVYVKIDNLSNVDETYTITFDPNLPTTATAKYPSAASGVKGSSFELPDATCEGYKFIGWYNENNQLVSSPYTITKNEVLKAKWEKDSSYDDKVLSKCTINIDEFQKVECQSYNHIDLTNLSDIKSKNYDILGYYADSNYTNAISNPSDVDISKYPNIYIKVRKIKYHYNDKIHPLQYCKNKSVEENVALFDALNTSIKFEYYTDSNYTNKLTNFNLNQDIIDVYVKSKNNGTIEEPQMHYIKFIPNFPSLGNAYSPSQTGGSESAVVTFPDARCSNYKFLGWYTEPEGGTKVSSPYTMGNNDITLYGHWEKTDTSKETYIITYDAQGGKSTLSNSYVLANSILDSLPKATKDGYEFLGWYTQDNKKLTTKTVITSNLTVYAKYKKIENNNTILTPTQKPGYKFIGWYTPDGKKVNNISQVSGNVQLQARYKKIISPKTYISKIKRKGSKISIKIKKVKSTGYQIKYSNKKNMKKYNIKNIKSSTIKIKSKKKCYIKVRSYIKDSTGKKVYSKWSKVYKK